MAYVTLTRIGAFGVCQDKGTPNFYVSVYLPEKGSMVYRSLRTTNLEDAARAPADHTDPHVAEVDQPRFAIFVAAAGERGHAQSKR